jgi:hypothetical protein
MLAEGERNDLDLKGRSLSQGCGKKRVVGVCVPQRLKPAMIQGHLRRG